ncbi:MAG: ferric reductase-like transmembrane domain-containing protein [Ahrensia sp.]
MFDTIKAVGRSKYFLWALMALPSIGLIGAAVNGSDLEGLLHPTGEFAARFMIIAMIATPLRMLFPTSAIPLWLTRHRRAFGVAAFAYAALHTVYYVIDLGSLNRIIADLPEIGIWTGWLAMAIFVPLAITSNNFSVRVMKRSWKTLQRLVYPAAVLTLVHWLFVANEIGGALAHFAPLAALEGYRIWKNWQAQQHTQVAA